MYVCMYVPGTHCSVQRLGDGSSHVGGQAVPQSTNSMPSGHASCVGGNVGQLLEHPECRVSTQIRAQWNSMAARVYKV